MTPGPPSPSVAPKCGAPAVQKDKPPEKYQREAVRTTLRMWLPLISDFNFDSHSRVGAVRDYSTGSVAWERGADGARVQSQRGWPAGRAFLFLLTLSMSTKRPVTPWAASVRLACEKGSTHVISGRGGGWLDRQERPHRSRRISDICARWCRA